MSNKKKNVKLITIPPEYHSAVMGYATIVDDQQEVIKILSSRLEKANEALKEAVTLLKPVVDHEYCQNKIEDFIEEAEKTIKEIEESNEE